MFGTGGITKTLGILGLLSIPGIIIGVLFYAMPVSDDGVNGKGKKSPWWLIILGVSVLFIVGIVGNECYEKCCRRHTPTENIQLGNITRPRIASPGITRPQPTYPNQPNIFDSGGGVGSV